MQDHSNFCIASARGVAAVADKAMNTHTHTL